jgi:hypothetical protein
MYLDQMREATKPESNPDEEKRKKIFKDLYSKIERQLARQVSAEEKFNEYKDLPFYQEISSYGIEIFPRQFKEYYDKNSADSKAYDAMLDKKWEEFKD